MKEKKTIQCESNISLGEEPQTWGVKVKETNEIAIPFRYAVTVNPSLDPHRFKLNPSLQVRLSLPSP